VDEEVDTWRLVVPEPPGDRPTVGWLRAAETPLGVTLTDSVTVPEKLSMLEMVTVAEDDVPFCKVRLGLLETIVKSGESGGEIVTACEAFVDWCVESVTPTATLNVPAVE